MLRFAHVVYEHYRADYNALFSPPLDPALDPAAADAWRFPLNGKPRTNPALPPGTWEQMNEPDQAIVCLVGDNIRYTPGVARRTFNALRAINVRMISMGASLLNLSFVVAEADLLRTVTALHDEFFATLDPSVFERKEAVHA